MREVWLRSNPRVLLVGMVLPGLAFVLGGVVVFAALNQAIHSWFALLGGLAMALALGTFGAVVQLLRTPRLAYENQQLLIYLGEPTPFRVPVEIVECFFLGQGPAMLAGDEHDETETKNIIVRLAEAAEPWKQREVKPRLGYWCNGYVTIRGTWCEPISPELVKELNHRLVEIHRAQRAAREKGSKST